MDTRRDRVITSAVLFVLIVSQGSDAWSLPNKLRRMLVTATATAPPLHETTHISPSPAPISEIKADQDKRNSSTAKPQKLPGPKDSSRVGGKTSNDTNVHVDKNLDKQVIVEKCDGSAVSSCTQNKMVACLKHSQKGSQDLSIIIQNEGKSVLNVSVIVPASIEISTKELKIPEHHVQKINVSTTVRKSLKIVLNASGAECELYTGVPLSEGNFFQKIPSYANQVTPMHGAYFMFAVTLIVGGTWACCKYVKRGQRSNGGIPYQELEMALPQSVSAVNGDAEDGWEQGWDDDWDDGGAVKSPGQLVGNPSANGLTSRSSNRDGWENDWDN